MRTVDHESHLCLLKSKLFEGLDETALKQVFDAAQARHFAPKKNVIVKGERPDFLYLLKKGRTRCYILTESGHEVLLLWVVPGDVLGLVTLLTSPPAHLANATTVTPCDFLVWDHAEIRRLAKAHPQISENAFRIALHHLEAYMKRHTSIITQSAEARLAQRLMQLATIAGEVRPSGIAIDITNEQLSSLSDIGFFTTSRILSKWEHDGKLAKERGRVTLLAPESLMAA